MPVECLPFIGFLAGLLVISFGGGGGAIYVGVLTALCGVPPELAASTSLATIIPTTFAGAFGHFRAGNVDLRLAGLLLLSIIPGTLIGTWCSAYIPESIYYLISAACLLVFSTQMLWTLIRQKGQPLRRPGQKLTAKETAEASFFGLLSGLMTGAIGLSGGGPITAALFLLRCPALRTVGTSVAVIPSCLSRDSWDTSPWATSTGGSWRSSPPAPSRAPSPRRPFSPASAKNGRRKSSAPSSSR